MGVLSVIVIKSNHFVVIFGTLVHVTVPGAFSEKFGKATLGPFNSAYYWTA